MCYLSSALQMLPSSAWSYLCILYSKCSSPYVTKHAYCVCWFWFIVNKCPGYAHADHLVWCSCILYKWSQFIRYYFVLSLRGPLIKEGPLGGCAVCRVRGRVLAGAEGNGARPRAGRAVFCVRMWVCLLVWSRLIRCSSFHSALLRFKELKGPTESEKQTDPFFPIGRERNECRGIMWA